jgi:WD40 repeat protein
MPLQPLWGRGGGAAAECCSAPPLPCHCLDPPPDHHPPLPLTPQVWDVGEGRQPWSSSLAQPTAALELRDFDSGVWALSSSQSGQLVVSGSEEGQVAAWDLRTGQQIWATTVSCHIRW